MYPLLLIAELVLLYLLSHRVIQTVFTIIFVLTRSRTIGIWIVTIIFFPGTVVHELAHLFTAEILGVHTGKLTLIPDLPAEAPAKEGSLEGPHSAEASRGETEIKAGGVMIAETDPLRRTLIGLAPVYVGVTVLAALSYFIRRPLAVLQGDALQNAFLFYLLFAISNSMFSSKEDMKGVIPFTVTVVIFIAAGYVAGFRLGLTGELLTKTLLVIETLVRSLGIVLAVNVLVLATTSILLALLPFQYFKKR